MEMKARRDHKSEQQGMWERQCETETVSISRGRGKGSGQRTRENQKGGESRLKNSNKDREIVCNNCEKILHKAEG